MTEMSSEPNAGYQAALDYLYSFINYENRMPPDRQHASFNLDRLRWLLAELGQPHLRWPSVVVAGTKGKGSTSAMIEAILRESGYRIGFFSSPHLHSWRERVQINRTLIDQSTVVDLTGRLRQIVARLPAELGPPTTFELATALAFANFAASEVDIAVLEVGLGGRYDTVNVVSPLLSVITPISYDHTAVLGNTLAEIAYAKAGIIKPGIPVVISPQPEEARAVILREARSHSPLWMAEPHALVPLANAPGGVRAYPVDVSCMRLALRGAHQTENARLAVATAMLIGEAGFKASSEAITNGLAKVHWPARFEVVEGSPPIVIDGAMNGASAARLRESLAELRYERLVLVLGTSQDKDVAAIAAELVPLSAAVVLTRSRHPRSAHPETLLSAVQPLLDGPVVLTDDVPPAIDRARDLAGPDGLVCVAGSLFVAAAAREALGLAAVID